MADSGAVTVLVGTERMHGDGANKIGSERTRAAERAAGASFQPAAALAGIAGEWRDLAANAVEPNSFYAPAMLLAALDAFAAERPEVALVRDGAGRLIGLAPIAPLRGYSRLPVRYVATWMHKHCFFGAPLVRPGHEEAFFSAIFDLVERRGAFLRLRHLDADGPLYAAAAAVAQRTGRLSSPSARYSRAMLRGPWRTDDYLKVSLSGKKRKDLRRLRSRLEEEGAVAVDRLGAGADIDPWTEEFLALEAAGWKGKAGTAMGGEAASTQFFRQAAGAAHRTGDVQMFRLRLGARTIAAAVNFAGAGVVYAFKVAYDEAFARYSPGVMLEIEMMKALEGTSGLSFVDSCAKAEHPMIERLWRERRKISALNVSRRDAPSKALFRLLAALEGASEAVRKPKEMSEDESGDGDI